MRLIDKLEVSKRFVRKYSDLEPEIGIILGTGLGPLQDEIEDAVVIAYNEIPNMPKSTVEGHDGKLILGLLSGRRVVCMAGRFHYYEGHDMKEVTYGVRLIAWLGAKRLLASNAAGGLNAKFQGGDFVMVGDHINFQPLNPLRGENEDALGPRFVDMLGAYDRTWIDRGVEYGRQNGIKVYEGVYLGLQGPSLETVSEYRMFRSWGADLVGMSTVPEVIVARHMGMAVTVISVVSNVCFPPSSIGHTTIESVLEVIGQRTGDMIGLVRYLLEED